MLVIKMSVVNSQFHRKIIAESGIQTVSKDKDILSAPASWNATQRGPSLRVMVFCVNQLCHKSLACFKNYRIHKDQIIQ